MDVQSQTEQNIWHIPAVMVSVIARVITVLIPILLVLGSVRLVMTELYLRLEYQRPGFPEDRYGWEPRIRLDYGPYGIHYLLNDADIRYLGDLQIDGEPAFTSRELAHMEDVKMVTRAAMSVLTISVIMFVAGAGVLAYRPPTRPDLLRAISQGGVGTLTAAGMLLITALISWDFFFDGFHALFFESGTWKFYNSDTLIRLYPQQFWFDSALVVGVMTLIGALLCAVVPRWWLRHTAIKDQT